MDSNNWFYFSLQYQKVMMLLTWWSRLTEHANRIFSDMDDVKLSFPRTVYCYLNLYTDITQWDAGDFKHLKIVEKICYSTMNSVKVRWIIVYTKKTLSGHGARKSCRHIPPKRDPVQNAVIRECPSVACPSDNRGSVGNPVKSTQVSRSVS